MKRHLLPVLLAGLLALPAWAVDPGNKYDYGTRGNYQSSGPRPEPNKYNPGYKPGNYQSSGQRPEPNKYNPGYRPGGYQSSGRQSTPGQYNPGYRPGGYQGRPQRPTTPTSPSPIPGIPIPGNNTPGTTPGTVPGTIPGNIPPNIHMPPSQMPGGYEGIPGQVQDVINGVLPGLLEIN